MWILQNHFSEVWGSFTPLCFYKCSKEEEADQMRRLDHYAINDAGETPAMYGYVKIEGDGNIDDGTNMIAFVCDSREILDFIYERICDAILHHPDVIDLRNDKLDKDIAIL